MWKTVVMVWSFKMFIIKTGIYTYSMALQINKSVMIVCVKILKRYIRFLFSLIMKAIFPDIVTLNIYDHETIL